MKVTSVGIDLAKNVFQLHGVNEFGKPTSVCTITIRLSPGVSVARRAEKYPTYLIWIMPA